MINLNTGFRYWVLGAGILLPTFKSNQHNLSWEATYLSIIPEVLVTERIWDFFHHKENLVFGGKNLLFSETHQKFLSKIILGIDKCSICSCLLIEVTTSLKIGARTMPRLKTRAMVKIIGYQILSWSKYFKRHLFPKDMGTGSCKMAQNYLNSDCKKKLKVISLSNFE